jgi:hypothetical protein
MGFRASLGDAAEGSNGGPPPRKLSQEIATKVQSLGVVLSDRTQLAAHFKTPNHHAQNESKLNRQLKR